MAKTTPGSLTIRTFKLRISETALSTRLDDFEKRLKAIEKQMNTTMREAHNANMATMRIGARRG